MPALVTIEITHPPTGSVQRDRHLRTMDPMSGDMDADVVVIGSGYTGLVLCHSSGQVTMASRPTVLDANTVAWGCSHTQWRSGTDFIRPTQALPVDTSAGVLMSQRKCMAKSSKAFDLSSGSLIGSNRNSTVTRKMAVTSTLLTKPGVMPKLEAESKLLNEVFGYKSRIMSREELHETVVSSMTRSLPVPCMEPDGISAFTQRNWHSGIPEAGPESLGVKIHPASPVMGWKVSERRKPL